MPGLLDRAKTAFGIGDKQGVITSDDVDDVEQSEDDKKLARWVRTKVEEVRSSANRISHEGIWMTNIAYLLGFNGLTYNTFSRQFVQVNDTSIFLRQRRIHINKILPTVQNRLARLCKNPPKYDVVPESNDSDDKDAARLSLDVLTAQIEKLGADAKRLMLYMWMQECGHAFIGVYWDPTIGNVIADPEKTEDGDTEFEGDVRLDVVSPFEMFPDPLAKDMDDLQWIVRAKVRPLEYFRSQYGDLGQEIKEEATWLLSAQYESRINSINTRGPAQGTIANIKNTAIELAYYEKRSRKYPRGRCVIAANGILLENKDLPCGEIPFAKFDDVLIGGKFYSDAIITHLRPIQDAYNTVVRMRTEWVRKLLTGKLIAPRGTQIAQESLNDQSEVFFYTPVPNAVNNGEPHVLQMPTIPQYAYTEQQNLDAMFNEISGISEVSKGNLPSASIPAIGMQLLVEQDDTRIGVVTENSEHGWAKVGSLILKNVQENYVLPRKIKMAGDSGYIVREIAGEDLKDHTDVKVVRGSTMPGSKVLKRQEILNAYGQGLLGNPQDPEVKSKILSWLEFGDTNAMWLDQSLDEAQIKRGIEDIEKGIIPPCNEFDNHPLWISRLNRYRKGEKFEALTPDIQKLVMTVMEAHLQTQGHLTGAIPQEPTPDQKAAAMQSANQATQTAGAQLGQELNNRAAAQPGNAPAAGPS